jgi:hypothetical protein
LRLTLEVPIEKILPIIPREAFEAAKAEYDKDPYVSNDKYATEFALNDMFEEDCDQKVALLTSEDLIDGLVYTRGERNPFCYIQNTCSEY